MPVLFITPRGRLPYDSDKDAQKEVGVAGGFVWRGPKWAAKLRKHARTSGEIESASLTLPLSNRNRQLCKLDGKTLIFSIKGGVFVNGVVRKEMPTMQHDKGTNKQTNKTNSDDEAVPVFFL